MTRRKNNEEFLKEVYDLVGNEYTFLEKYKTNKTKIKVKHNVCGNIYEVTPNKFRQGGKCYKCFNIKRTKTNEEFLKEVYDLVGDEYSFLEPYKNVRTKLKVKHNICGNIYEVSPSKFLQGRRCPKCAIEKTSALKRKTNDEFLKEVYDLVADEYSVLGEYKNANIKLKIKHNKCGCTYEVRPADFLRGIRCPQCNGKFKKTTQQFKQEVHDSVGNEYSVLGEYINTKTKIELRHNKCGHTYKVKPYHFLCDEVRCPYCRAKLGEKKIINYLDNHKVNYEFEYNGFEWLTNKKRMHIDFYLFDYNLGIEFDGNQHSNIIGKEKERYYYNVKIDKLKDKLCKEHNVKLVRIPYNKIKNIDIELDKILNNMK